MAVNIKDSKYIFEEFETHYRDLAGNNLTFNNYKKEISRIFEKNERVLNSDLLGLQLLINKLDEDKINNILKVDNKKINNSYKNSPYFQQFEKDLRRKDQMIFLIPQLLFCNALLKNNKIEEAKFVFFSCYLKPYASRVSVSFPHKINEGQMRYTVENTLNEKYAIKKLGSLYKVLYETSNTAFENYRENLKNNPTDSLLYDIIVSGFSARVGSFLKIVADRYYSNKGKYLEYERSNAIAQTGDSAGESFELEIESNSAIKRNVINKTMMKIATNPVDDRFINIAYKMGYKINTESKTFFNATKVAISTIIKKKSKELEKLFDALLNVFLYYEDSDSRMTNVRDIKSIKFIQNSLMISKTANNKDPNVETVKKIVKSFLDECSIDYVTYKSETQKRSLEKSCLLYFTIVLQQAA